MIALGCALIFAFLFILPFKTELKSAALITVVVCSLVIVSNALYYTVMYKPVINYAGTEASVQGEVISVNGSSVTVRCDTVTVNDNSTSERFNAKFSIKSPINVYPTAKISLTANFYDKAYRKSGDDVHIMGYASEITILSTHNPKSIRYFFYKIRENIKSIMPFKADYTKAFINGIVFGDVSQISGVVINKLNTVGLSHVTSVSGMHLVFSVLLIDLLLSLFAVGHKPRAVFAILSVAAFSIISGFAVSCIRAAIMLAIYYIGVLNDKIADSFTSLSVAVYLILLFSPNSINSLSLVLSASATFGIIFFSPGFKRFFRFNIQNRVAKFILYGAVSLFVMSISASICCLPLTAVLFEKFCIISPIINLVLAIPIQILFYVGILGIVFGAVPFVSDFLSLIGDLLYNVIEFVVSKCYYINNTVVTAGFSFYYIILALILAVALGLYLFYKTKRPLSLSLWYVGGFCIICLVVFGANKFVTYGTTEVNFVDVGDGNCSVISKNESAVIIDCGGEYYDEVERVLCHSNVKSIKLLAITHFDEDHVNFLLNLIDTYDIDCIAYPHFTKIEDNYNLLNTASKNGTTIKMLKTDDEIDVYDGVKISWFVEKASMVKPNSNMSAVYRADIYGKSILYTGDMNIYQENAYLYYSNKMNCDILNVAHHGSKTSSHMNFLNLCSPEYSVVSVSAKSKDNPSDRIIERLKSISNVLLTSNCSTITFLFDDKGYKRIK